MSESETADHYTTLGVARDANVDEIKSAFRRLARECHPDVAGDDPKIQLRFTQVREAYETLVDPVRRATYDRRGYSTMFSGPGRNGGKWRPPGGFDFEQVGDPSPHGRAGPSTRRGRRNPANDIGLEDIFGDFGGGEFGFGGPQANAANRGSWGRPASSGPVRGGPAPAAEDPRPGRDIHLKVDVPSSVAGRGGTVTLRYPRLLRGDDGHGLHRYPEIHDLRVPPGVKSGDTLRVPGYGDAGVSGGAYGELVCDITVVRDEDASPGPQSQRGERRSHGSGPRPSASPPPAAPAPGEVSVVEISVVEALLGGRIKVQTPAGPVHVSIPPCSDSGARLRLRGRGVDGGDHLVELRILTPRTLDDESRSLIERFAELNPVGPRED